MIVRGVTIKSLGPNSDGCDPESCKNVLIENCNFFTGDDCIAIKSGRNADGRRIHIPSERIIIRNCNMYDGHGGIVISSEVSGGVKNIFAEKCTMNSPHLLKAFRIKTNSMRGGIIENIYFRNMEIGEVREQVIRVNMNYEDSGPFKPIVQNIYIENITVEKGGKTGILLEGLEDSPVNNVILKNVKIQNAVQDYKFINVRKILFEGVTINGNRIDLK